MRPLRNFIAPLVLTIGTTLVLSSSPAFAGCFSQAGFTKAWNGVDANWSAGTNWVPAGVPAAADSVYICAGASAQPALSANVSITNLWIDTGAVLNVGSFTINASGNVDAALISGSGMLTMSGAGKTLKGNVPDLRIPGSGDITLNGLTNASGTVVLAAGDLTLGGNTFNVAGDFRSESLGDRLNMNNAIDVLNVAGDVHFIGGGATGILTAGELRVGGNFIEANVCCTGTAFRPSGTHKTVFNGSTTQTVSFNTGGNNAFNDVEIVGAGTVVITAVRPNVVLNGSLYDSVGGRWQVENTYFKAPTLTLPASLQTNAFFTASTTLASNFVLDGDMTVSATLIMGGHVARVTGDFTATSLGDNFQMHHPADRLIVDGNVRFQGGGGLNLMDAGEIRIKGNFTEANACCTGQAFRPTGDHLVVFEGTNSTITFNTGGSNSFNKLAIEGNVTLASNVNAQGQLISSGAGLVSVIGTGSGATITAAGLDVAKMQFDNARLASVGGQIDRVEDLVFQNQQITATQFSVTHPGGPFTFLRTQFLTTPTTGKTMKATDSATTDSNPLILNMTDSTPADGSAHESENAGAIINWSANVAPSATADSYTTNEDQRLDVNAAAGVLSNDSDPESAPLTASVVTAPSVGTLDLRANGSFSYIPPRDFFGAVNFVYAATDPQGLQSTATVTITITALNDAPVAREDNYSTPANVPLEVSAPGILANDDDVDDESLNASLESPTAHGSVTVFSDGSFVYVPNNDFVGTDSFTYSSSDGDFASSATVRIGVTDTPARIDFRSNQLSIRKGDSATLLWQTLGASAVTIEPGLGTVSARGSAVVTPVVTTTYTLTAQARAGAISKTLTIHVLDAASVALVARPKPIMQDVAGAADSSRFVVSNVGGTTAAVSLERIGDFFSQSPEAFTLAPGETQIVTLIGNASPAGHYEGSSKVLVNGSLAVTVPIYLLSVVPSPASTRVTATAHRTHVTGVASGEVTFTNNSSGEVRGVISSDVPWIRPRTKSATLAAGGSTTIIFDVDRSQRPSESTTSGALTFTYLADGEAAGKIVPFNGAPVFPKAATVTIRDVVTPVVTGSGIPALDPSQVAHYLPGLVRNTTVVSDLAVMNTSTVGLSNISLFLTPLGASPLTSRLMQLPQLATNSSSVLPDAIKSAFGSTAELATVQVRGDAASLRVVAEVTNVVASQGTVGTAILPLRSDRAASKGESLFLSGVEKDAHTRTDLFLQETSGASATASVVFLDDKGAVVQTRNQQLQAFGSVELHDAVGNGVVAVKVTNSASSNGRIVARALVSDSDSGDLSEIVDWSRNFGVTATEEQLVPWVAANPTTQTDLMITNRGSSAASGRLTFTAVDGRRRRIVKPGSSSSSAIVEQASFDTTIEVDPQETLLLSDVLRTTFHATGTVAGYLTYVPLSGDVAMMASLTTTRADGKQLVVVPPVMKRDLALIEGGTKRFSGVQDSPATATALQTAGSYRNAIGLLETSDKMALVRVRMFYTHVPSNSPVAVRASAERTYTLRPGALMMIDDVSTALLGPLREAFGELHDTDIDVEVLDGDGAVLPFVLTTDNGSKDTKLRID